MQPIFRQSKETETLVGLFRQMPINSNMSFDEASATVGFRVKSSLPAYQAAKRIAERDFGVVVDGIRGFGFMRLDGKKMVERAPRGFKKIRRISRREARVQEIAISQNLTRDDMLKATEQLARYRLLETTSHPRPASNKPEKANVAPIQHDVREDFRKIGR